jgi:hypothetical protein
VETIMSVSSGTARRAIGCAVLALGLAAVPAAAAEVIELTQTGCQFLEPEGMDHGFKTSRKADCEAINAKSGDGRVAAAKVITLNPGKYVFRVANRNVPYVLGFWLREKGYNWLNPIHKATKLSVSGGGIATGTSRDYEVDLAPGEYVFSCPLNTTPDYKLVVTGD